VSCTKESTELTTILRIRTILPVYAADAPKHADQQAMHDEQWVKKRLAPRRVDGGLGTYKIQPRRVSHYLC